LQIQPLNATQKKERVFFELHSRGESAFLQIFSLYYNF